MKYFDLAFEKISIENDSFSSKAELFFTEILNCKYFLSAKE